VREETRTGVGIWAEINENKIVETFRKIQQLRRFKWKDASQLQTINLNDALSKYESGIGEFELLIKFKHLFNSLEVVTNVTGTEWKGDKFDNEVQKIVSVSTADSREWREFYNRAKHVQKDSKDINKYYDGIDTLPDKLLAVRSHLNEVLLSKL
jgi:hypothetical protein